MRKIEAKYFVLCGFVVLLIFSSPCLANCTCWPKCNPTCCNSGHGWSPASPITATLIPEFDQQWYVVGSVVGLFIDAEDTDTRTCCVNGTEQVGSWLEYSWQGQFLIEPLDWPYIYWYPNDYTSSPVEISVTVSDPHTDLPYNCDTGSRHDPDVVRTIELGAFQASAFLEVASSNDENQTVEVYQLDYRNYALQGPPFEPAPMAEISVSLDSETIALGNFADGTLISPNPDTDELGMISSDATWTMSCVPKGKWNSYKSGWVECKVDRVFDGNLVSSVWDNDFHSSGGDVTVGVSFGGPISISISHTFNLGGGPRARAQAALGFGYQSCLAFGGSGFHGKAEHTHDSANYSYNGETPNIKPTSINHGSGSRWWTRNRDSILTAQMKTQTEGWVKMQERIITHTHPYPGGVNYSHKDAYVEAYQEGTAAYRVGWPRFWGTRYSNPDWPW